MTQTYSFTITFVGSGDTLDEAFADAMENARCEKLDVSDTISELLEDDQIKLSPGSMVND